MRTTGYVYLLAVVAVALLCGCRTGENVGDVGTIVGVKNPSIHILFDTTRPLPVSGTFGWGVSLLRVDASHRVDLSDVQDRLHRSLLASLPAEGFTFTDSSPDYLVGFAVMEGASLSEAELNGAYGSLLSFPSRDGNAPPLNYATGVLILDIVERERGHLLWRGAIKADLDMDLTGEGKQARCDGAVRELLRHYPSPSGGR